MTKKLMMFVFALGFGATIGAAYANPYYCSLCYHNCYNTYKACGTSDACQYQYEQCQDWCTNINNC